MWRYFVWLLAVFGLILILIFLILPSSTPKTAVPGNASFYSYANSNAVVSLNIDGPINADVNHQSAQISVSKEQVKFDQFQGYNGHIVNEKVFTNNEAAFDNFLHAIYHAGFTLGNKDASLSDETGYCPLGDRYVFKLSEGSNTVERYWSTSCGTPKTFKGNLSLNMSLFENQVPNYQTLTQNINF